VAGRIHTPDRLPVDTQVHSHVDSRADLFGHQHSVRRHLCLSCPEAILSSGEEPFRQGSDFLLLDLIRIGPIILRLCGELYHPTGGASGLCSVSCQVSLRQKQHTASALDSSDKREFARHLSDLRSLVCLSSDDER
jgi:hypothetical protein